MLQGWLIYKQEGKVYSLKKSGKKKRKVVESKLLRTFEHRNTNPRKDNWNLMFSRFGNINLWFENSSKLRLLRIQAI